MTRRADPSNGTRRQAVGPQPAALALALAFGGMAQPAGANPSGGVAVHGQASMASQGRTLTVTTRNGAGSSHAAINWQSFNIPVGNVTVFQQPSAASTVINRVVTSNPSQIFGTLSSNGRLVLVNQSGIAIGAGAVIDTAGFTASALRMGDADALAGRMRFGAPDASMGGAGGLSVAGRVLAREGDVVLIAPSVEIGAGALVQAPNGSTVLAAGRQVEITGRGYEGIRMVVQAPTDQARNLGRLQGDAVAMFAGTLRHSGQIQASTATLDGGKVLLKASGDTYIEGGGQVLATGVRGGQVDVLGDRVAVAEQALVDVSGSQGGGSIRVGGDYQGKNPDVSNARRTYLGPQAVLRADATGQGDGGRVIVWADEQTKAHGTVSARGGAAGGDGGFVEISGKHKLVFDATVDTRAPKGKTGTLLLDPDFIDVSLGGLALAGSVDEFADSPGASLVVSPLTLAALLSNVTLQATEDITFNDPLTLTAPGASLTAHAGGIISVGAAITTNAGDITLYANAPLSGGPGSGGSGVFVSAPISSGGGNILIRSDASDVGGNSIQLSANVNAGAGTLTLHAPFDRIQQLGGTMTAQNLIATADYRIDLNLAGNNIAGDVNLFTNTGTASGSLLQFRNDTPGSFNLNGAIAKGNVTITSAGPMTTDGAIQSTTGNVTIASTGGVSFGDDVIATGTLTLTSTNNTIGQSGGALVVGGATTINAGTGDVFLPNAGNNFSSVSVAGGNIAVSDQNALTITSFTRNVANANLSFDGGAGALVVPAGPINTGLGQLYLFSGGAFTTPGDLTASHLQLRGSPSLTLAHNLSTPGTLLLQSAGTPITQTAGTITVGGVTTLSAPGGAVSLALGGNDFNSISGSSGALTVVDSNDLAVDAAGINSANGNVNLQATGIGALTLNGSINAGAGNVTLSARPITQTSGSITGNVLTVNSSLGSISLPNGNDVSAIRFSGSGASTVTLFNLKPTSLLSGSGGNLTFTSPGQVMLDQTTTLASGLDITATNGITLAADVTPGANLNMASSTGLISQISGTLFANSGTATFNSAALDLSLPSASNEFNVVNLGGGHITVVASGGLIVNSLASGSNRNVFLQAGPGGLILPGSPVNAGSGQISFISGGSILGGGNLNGSDILLQAASGLSIPANIQASGSLTLSSPIGSGISQAGGTGIVVAGPTTIAAGSSAVTLNESGNNFATVHATGGSINLRDSNDLVLGNVNAGSSLTVQTGGHLAQSFPVLVSGTTSLTAGGNVTLTTPGNNLNQLAISAQAIDVVEGAGSSLTVLSLSSGANQPVSIAAGHTLTLPATPINTGSADITLSSPIGTLNTPGTLSGQNVYLQSGAAINVLAAVNAGNDVDLDAVTGINIFAPVTAGGLFSASNTTPGTPMMVRDQVTAGSMNISLAGGLHLLGQSPGTGAALTTNGPAGQVIGALYIEVVASSGTGSAQISSNVGGQSITTSGNGGTGNSILVHNVDHAAGFAQIVAFGAGTQTVTANNGNSVWVHGQGGEAQIHASGSQVITLQGSGSNLLVLGNAGNTEASGIESDGNQTIVVGTGAQSGGIVIAGGVSAGFHTGISSEAGTQSVTTVGNISVTAGTAAGVNGAECDDFTMGACAGIAYDGAVSQFVRAQGIQLNGGASGSFNRALIFSTSASASQTIQIDGGSLAMFAGATGDNNRVAIQTNGPSQTIDFSAPGGAIQLTGGGAGTSNLARIVSTSPTSIQTISGAPSLTLQAGAGGGGFGVGNRADLLAQGSQNLTIGGTGISMSGGGGTGLETDNAVVIDQAGLAGTTQVINVVNGNIAMTGGSSAMQDVGGSGHGSRAVIEARGDSQTITMSGGGNISLTGGSVGSRSFAQIFADNSATQTITGAGTITLTGGASGGGIFNAGANFEGNRGAITTNLGAQIVSAGTIELTGGSGGQANNAQIFSGGNQTVTASSGMVLQGGSGGGGTGSLGNSAFVQTTVGSQTVNVGTAGLSLTGGSGGLGEINNVALVRQGDNSVARPGTTQTINVSGGGSITLQGGSTSQAGVGLVDCGSCAVIRTDGDLQTISFASGGFLDLTGGSSGSRNHASVFAGFASAQVVSGVTGISLVAGNSGGGAGEGNFAFLGTNSGSQTVSVGANGIQLQGGGGGIENTTALRQSTSTGSTAGFQSITIGGGGALSLDGGAGSSNFSRVQNFGATQTIAFPAGGAVNMMGGTGASLNFVRVEAINGSQSITGQPSIQLTGGASGGADLNGNFAQIIATLGNQTISANQIGLNAGAGGINNFVNVSAPLQVISAVNNMHLTGGGSAASLDGTIGGGARLGGVSSGATNLTLSVGNDLTLTGGSVSGVSIGANSVGGNPTALDITVNGNFQINPGSVSTAGARVGGAVANPAGGNITINVPNGSFALNGAVAGETGVRTLGDVTVNANTVFVNNLVSADHVVLDSNLGVALGGVASINALAATGDTLKVDAGPISFINSAGAAALVVQPGARWLVFSNDPASDTVGALPFAFKQYGKLFGDANPILGSGNGLLYGITPTASATLVGAVSKAYDGTTAATLSAGNYSATGAGTDVVVLNNPVAGSYDTKNVGSGKTVSVNGVTVASVTDAGMPVFGYNAAVGTVTGAVGDISQAAISAIGGITAQSRPYDATTVATLNVVGATFTGMAVGDNLTIGGASGNFADKHVGVGKTVNVTGISVGGPDAGNYSSFPTTSSASGNITPASISSVSGITASNKNYDGNTSATLNTGAAIFNGAFGGDVLTVASASGAFVDKNAAFVPKTVNITGITLGGGDVGNYTLASNTAGTTANINQAQITAVTGITANKVYDGNTSATPITAGATLVGMVGGDSLSIGAGASASFDTRHVGVGKAVNVLGLTLAGPDAGNYNLVSATATGTGSITQLASVTWTGAGGNQLWSNPANWAGNALPDGYNVAAVVIPASAGTVQIDPGVGVFGITSLSSGSPIQQTGSSLVTPGLVLNTQGGVALFNATNQIGALSGSNGGSGDILLLSLGNMHLGPLTNSAGAIDVAIDGNMLVAGGLAAGTLVALSATGSFYQNAAIIGPAGVAVSAATILPFGPLATTQGAPISYDASGSPVTPPPTELGASDAGASPDVLLTFVELFEAAIEEQQSDDAALPGTDEEKKKVGDAIVAEGDVCR